MHTPNTAQLLGFAFALGGSEEHIQSIFDTVSANLEYWQVPSVSINSDDELHEHFGDKAYE